MDAATAGSLVSLSVLMQGVASLVGPGLAVRRRDQSSLNVAVFALSFCGLLGCLFAPLGGMGLWVALLGIGQGALFSFAITAIVLRSADVGIAARLSGMAQSVGYTLAAGGPLLMGVIRGATGSYAATALLFAALSALGMWSAWGAGRARQITS